MYGHDYHMMKMMQMMGRGRARDREYFNRAEPFSRQSKNAKKSKQLRLVDPKNFAEVFQNPLTNLMPFVEYLSAMRIEREPEERHERQERHWRRDYDRRFDEYEDDREEDQQADLEKLLRGKQKHTFDYWKLDILRQLENYQNRMDKNRKTNIDFIEKNLAISLKQYDLLNPQQLQQNWKRVQSIIKTKLQAIEDSFGQKRKLLENVKPFEKVLEGMLNERQEVKMVRQLNVEQVSSLFNLLINYLALPTLEDFHLEITTFERRSREIFAKLGDEESEMNRVLKNLPYKESSFYWAKIIDCCRYISDCEHYNDLDSRKVESFEAEYAGLVTHDILRKLKEDAWLDNSITSAVIEYLKQVEGANNYHNDNNMRVCLFTHSETDIFINNPRENAEGYQAYQKLIFLVNYENKHWFVITVYNTTNQIVIYDSLGTYQNVYQEYSERIAKKLRRKRAEDFQLISFQTPRQSNASDCGVFSIINIICAFDKENSMQRANRFNTTIISEIRHSLFLFLLYLGYCKRLQVVPRKDYFDILFRSTIMENLKSKLHEGKRR